MNKAKTASTWRAENDRAYSNGLPDRARRAAEERGNAVSDVVGVAPRRTRRALW
jgi:hypothetical protein